MQADLLLQLFPSPVIVTDDAERVVKWNPAAEAWFAIAAEAAVGRPLAEVLPVGAAALQSLRGADASQRSHPASPGQGGRGPGQVCFRAVALPPRGGGGTLLLAEDATHHTSPGADTAELHPEWAAVREQQARNDAEREQLRQDAVRRDRFFSSMSHDLRTPMTAVMGYSELLIDDIVGALTEQQREMVGRISQVAHDLAQMLTHLLDLAKLDAGRMQFSREPVPLAATLREVVAEAREQIEGSEAEVRLNLEAIEGTVMLGDDVRVRQVLATLVSHALRLTEEALVAVYAKVENGTAQIMVCDFGPVLLPEGEEAVFEEFARSPAGTAGQRGAIGGLGLPIARRLARAMGGELTVAPRTVGAAFILHLPLGELA